MSSTFRLQDRIAVLIASGSSLDEIEQEVIEPADISDEHKASLWLYAWSTFHGTIASPTGSRARDLLGL